MDYTIEYNGKTNLDFGMYWDTDENFELGTGTPNIDTTDIPGVSGTILDFNGSYKSFSQKFVFYAVHKDTTANQLKTRLTTWLLQDPTYHRLSFANDPDYYYIAAPDPSTLLKFPAFNKHYSKIEISFLIKPFKYRLNGRKEFPIPVTLVNQERWHSYPLIHIVGDEGIALQINDKKYRLTDIDGEVFIDSQPEKSMVYHDLTSQGFRNQNAIFPDHQFPVLEPGDNNIKITGNYKSATIIPRWRTLC